MGDELLWGPDALEIAEAVEVSKHMTNASLEKLVAEEKTIGIRVSDLAAYQIAGMAKELLYRRKAMKP